MKTQENNMDAYTILESDEFDTLLDAVELMAKAQGNLLSLQRSVEELKVMMEETCYAQDEFTLNDNIVCNIADIHEKYDYLEIKKKLNKTDLQQALRLFRRYNLIEATGDLTVSTTKIVLMPTILLAIPSEDINSLYQTINRIKQGGEEE